LLQRYSNSVFHRNLWRCLPICLLTSLLGYLILEAVLPPLKSSQPPPVILQHPWPLLLLLAHCMLISLIACSLFSIRLKQYDNEISQQPGHIQPPAELTKTVALLTRTTQQLGLDQAEKALLIEQMKAAQPLLQSGRQCAALLHDVSTPAQFIGDNLAFLHDSHQQLMPLLQSLNQLDMDVLPDRLEQQLQALDLGYLLQEIPHAIRQSRTGVEQISQLTSNACCWLHPDTQHRLPVDMAGLAQQASALTRGQWSGVATLTISASPALPRIRMSPNRVLQVLVNLISNAADAIRLAQRAEGKISIKLSCDSCWLRLNIRDNGAGIPESVAHRLFEPFITSKAPGDGTGLGLSICKDIIEQEQGGRLGCETQRGAGTTFTVEWPLK